MNKLFIYLSLISFISLSYSQENNYEKFTKESKKFNDWSVSLYVGTPLIQTGDLTSIENGVGDWDFGYDVQLGINKAITHAFGLILEGQIGQTKQTYGSKYSGKTDYWSIGLLGDLNLSSLFRRRDNQSEYTWAIHGYAGFAALQYKAYRNLVSRTNLDDQVLITDDSEFLEEIYPKLGLGIKKRLSRRIDVEFKAMYHYTNKETFDGSGKPQFNSGGTRIFSVADVEEGVNDNFMTFNLGLTYKIGKHDRHLMWVDPFSDLNNPEELEPLEFKTCIKGDNDNDSVCDDWDKQLDTPAGARVDGSGIALDIDRDGVIDRDDKCVTVIGPRSNDGCPIKNNDDDDLTVSIDGNNINMLMKAALFYTDSDKFYQEYAPGLNKAYDIINQNANSTVEIIGHTDSRGTNSYNQALSLRRAKRIKNYLVSKGISANRISVTGKGESMITNRCTNGVKCSANEHKVNRRIDIIITKE